MEDFRRNGKACISGLAYESAPNQATCVSATEVIFNGEKTPHPYACDPQDPDVRCLIKYDTKYSSKQWLDRGGKDQITVNCSCALSDETSGYCKDVIGTDPYAKYARQMYYILSNSHCHTLDRDDVRAQRDSCGVGVLDEEWRFAVDLKFNITHWPYIQTPDNYHCVQKFFSDSFINMSLDSATTTIAALATAIALVALV